MSSANIPKSTFNFLADLRKNNNRAWFNDHKATYQAELTNVKAFTEDLLDAMRAHDNIEGLKLFRIYRDTRFSNDKTPYKSSWSGGMKRATQSLRGGYYFHLEPGNTHIGGGFYNPNAADLKLIRDKIARDDKPLRTIIADPDFKRYFGTLKGETVKTAPKGFSKDHPVIDLIRHKQFIVSRSFTDKEVLSKNFRDMVVETYNGLRPFFDYMSEVLTTDMNGVPIYE